MIMTADFEYKMNSADEAISIFMGVMFAIIICLSIPLNISAINILKKRSKRQLKLIEMIPISMCFCNLIQTFPLYILYAICAFARKWILGFPMCQFMGFWVHFNANSSIWHLVAYSLEQRRAVGSDNNLNIAWHDIADWKKYTTLALAWLHGLFWSIIPFTGWCGYQFEGLGSSCSVTWEYTDAGSVTYTICILIFNFIFPCVIIANCYLKIFLNFKSHVSSLSSSIAASTQVRNKIRLRKLATVGGLMTGSFLFSWAPYAVIAVYMVCIQRPAHPILVTVPAVFAKCSVVIYPSFIIMRKSTFKLRWGEVSRPIVTKANELQKLGVTKT